MNWQGKHLQEDQGPGLATEAVLIPQGPLSTELITIGNGNQKTAAATQTILNENN